MPQTNTHLNILPYHPTSTPRSPRPLIFLSILLLSLYSLQAAFCEYVAETIGRFTTGSWYRHNPLLAIRTELTSGNAAAAMSLLSLANLLFVLAQLLLPHQHPYTMRQARIPLVIALLPFLAQLLITSFYFGPAYE